ncbi:MAG: type II toxin-antitoxin system HicB family antitoxin [Planctomycetales bacterium]
MPKSATPDPLEYTAAYHQGEEGWIIAEIVDFPGVASQGRTLKSAQRMIRDALQFMAECMIEEGQPLPRPNPRAGRRKAIHTEKIPLRIRVRAGAAS